MRLLPISFRLTRELNQELYERASANGMSRGEYARFLVMRALERQDDLEVADTLQKTHALGQRTFAFLRAGIELILLNCSSTKPSCDEVRQLLSKHLSCLIMVVSFATSGNELYALNENKKLDYTLRTSPGLAPEHSGWGAELLGIRGLGVTREHVLALAKAIHPLTGERLTRQRPRNRQQYLELTTSSPKAPSALYLLGSEETQAEVLLSQKYANSRILALCESDLGVARRGKEGLIKEPVAGLAITSTPHLYARPAGAGLLEDIHIHTHNNIWSCAPRRDGTWGAFQFLPFYEHGKHLGCLYRMELGHQLRVRLGVHLVKRNSFGFGILGIPEALCDAFSKRTRVIDEAVADFGASSPAVRQMVALLTRVRKGQVDFQKAKEDGWEVARRHGLTEESLRGLLHSARPLSPATEERLSRKAVDTAAREVAAEHGHFSRVALAGAAARKLEHRGVSIDRVLEATDLALSRMQELGQHRGITRYTTKEHYNLERRLLRAARAAGDDHRHRLTERELNRALSKCSLKPEGEQLEALRALALQARALDLLQGEAGTGKTAVLMPLAAAYSARGYRVIGAAPSARAADELRGAGIQSTTVAALLKRLEPTAASLLKHHARQLLRAARKKRTWRPERLDSRTLLVVDEAGMASVQDLARLVRLSKKAGARVLLVGDPMQLQPVLRPGAFRDLAKMLGASELKANRRQRKRWEIEALSLLRQGDAEGALSMYMRKQRLHLAPSRTEAKDKLIERWKEAPTPSTLMLAISRADVRELNERAQAFRRERGELGALSVSLLDGTLAYPGDRLLFRENSRKHGVINGLRGTLEQVRQGPLSGARISARLDDGRQVIVPVDKVEVQLGYAMTCHSAQGATAERALVLLGGRRESLHTAYVALSRARESTEIFIEEHSVGEDLQELAKSLRRTQEQALAHGILP